MSNIVSKYCQDPEDVSLLADCCKAADNCCSKIEKLTNVTKSFIASNSSTLDLVETWNSDLVGSCPATWDGWQCWDPGHPGKNSSKYIIHDNHQYHHSSFFVIVKVNIISLKERQLFFKFLMSGCWL